MTKIRNYKLKKKTIQPKKLVEDITRLLVSHRSPSTTVTAPSQHDPVAQIPRRRAVSALPALASVALLHSPADPQATLAKPSPHFCHPAPGPHRPFAEACPRRCRLSICQPKATAGNVCLPLCSQLIHASTASYKIA